eukprot:jgi/Bigna1/75267/fgenesh1_pg.33_\
MCAWCLFPWLLSKVVCGPRCCQPKLEMIPTFAHKVGSAITASSVVLGQQQMHYQQQGKNMTQRQQHCNSIERKQNKAKKHHLVGDSQKSEIDGAAEGFVSTLKRYYSIIRSSRISDKAASKLKNKSILIVIILFDSNECIENGQWRCPLNWCEIKGLLMDPRIQRVRDYKVCSDEAILRDFIHKLRVTKRLKLRKTLNEQERVLKRELRRDTDDEEDQQERERAVKDARVTLLLLSRPEIGLASEADMMRGNILKTLFKILAYIKIVQTPVIGKTVGRIRNLMQRITNGEVDKSKVESKAVKCNTCGGKLVISPY